MLVSSRYILFLFLSNVLSTGGLACISKGIRWGCLSHPVYTLSHILLLLTNKINTIMFRCISSRNTISLDVADNADYFVHSNIYIWYFWDLFVHSNIYSWYCWLIRAFQYIHLKLHHALANFRSLLKCLLYVHESPHGLFSLACLYYNAVSQNCIVPLAIVPQRIPCFVAFPVCLLNHSTFNNSLLWCCWLLFCPCLQTVEAGDCAVWKE